MHYCLIYFIILSFTIPMKSKVYVKIGRKSPFELEGRRVMDGQIAKLGDVPYQVAFKKGSIGRNKFHGKTFCGGALIAPSKVLTAAHCVAVRKSRFFGLYAYIENKNINDMFAVMGDLFNVGTRTMGSSDTDSQWRRLRHVTAHKDFNFPSHDIAVVFISGKFNYNKNVQSIPYAKKHEDYQGNCQISGYGRTNYNKRSSVLQTGLVELMKISECDKMFERNTRNFICSKKSLSVVGKGDSGGPLVCYKTRSNRGLLVGVVSGTQDLRGTRLFSFYTRTSSYVKFIESSNRARSVIHGDFVDYYFMFILNTIIVYCL
ncbi:ovochymase isoform X1 [Plutella xylostella]|uniref:ovochymase isoform X1 n=1 Tax=Plutella xylostella TaxID=51655 RepID=UPI002032EA82|nr:ovochymase isoform X1 [Plutella xylostella]